jgi:hypothetical protein
MTKRGGRGATTGCGGAPLIRRADSCTSIRQPTVTGPERKPAQGFYRVQFNIPIENVNDPFMVVLATVIKDIVGNFGASDFKVFKKELK